MSTLKELEIKNIFLLVVLVLIAYLAITLFLPYLNIIIVALILVQIFHPFYKFFLRRTKSKAISTTLSVILTILLMIIPIIILALLTLSEVSTVTANSDLFGSLSNLQSSINVTIDNINNVFKSLNLNYTISSLNSQQLAVSIANNVQDQLLPFVQQFLSLSGLILFSLFLLLLCLIYFFPIYDNLPEIISRLSPLDKDLDLILVKNFKATTKGVIKGSFFVAILQATAVLIPLLILNVGAPILLWIIMVILSLLPIGSGLVWGPLGIFLAFDGIRTGNASEILIAVALVVYCAVIINVIDTTVRPRIMKNTVKIHPLVTIFSVLGGLYYFGPLGILYGPLIIVFFISIIDIYHQKFLSSGGYLKVKYDEDD